MKDLNQCNFIGRLGKDVEVKAMPSGISVANFSIACSDDYKDKTSHEAVQKTNWVNVVAFGSLADICSKYIHKGSKIFISGKMQTRKWQDQSGQDKYTTEIVCGDMQMLDPKDNSQGYAQQSQNVTASKPQPQVEEGFNDDIPF